MTDHNRKETRRWMAEWLFAFLESNADDLAEKDAIVLDQIRAHLTGSPSGVPEPLEET